MHLRLALRGQPDDALESEEAGEGAGPRTTAERRVQALGVEGPPRAEDEARDAVLGRLGRVLVLPRLHQPVGVRLGPLEAKARLAEQQRGIDAAVHGPHDLGGRIDPAQQRLDRVAARAVEQVGFVDEKHVGKLELLAEQMGDGTLVVCARLPAAVDQRVHRRERAAGERMAGVLGAHLMARASGAA